MSKSVIQSKQTRKKCDKAFKCQAVERWLNSGKAATLEGKRFRMKDQPPEE